MRQLRCYFAIAAGTLLIAAQLHAQESRPDTGIVYGQQYVNSYFGFSYHFPTGWSGTAMRLTMASQVYPLFAASPGNGSSGYITIQAERLGQNGNVKTGKDFLTMTAGMLADPSNGVEALPGNKHYVFNSKEFDRIDLRSTANGALVRQALVCTVLRNYAVTFQFKASNDTELEDLVGTMLALNFLDPGQASTAATTPAQIAPTRASAPSAVSTTPAANQVATQRTTTAPTTTQPTVSNPGQVISAVPANPSATTGAPSALINMASPPHTLVGETLPATTMPETGSQPLVKVASKPDTTKTAVIQAVMPALSAELSTTTVRSIQGNTPSPSPANRTIEPIQTTAPAPVRSAELTPVTPPSVSVSKATPSPGAIAGKSSTEVTRIQISAATLESYVVRKVPATYPLAARQGRVEGLVELTIFVDEKGEVQDVKANSGPDILARSAEEALRHWRFRPIIIDGKATPIESRVSLNFQLPR